MNVEELVAEERKLLAKFAAKSAELRNANPRMPKSDSLVAAVNALPNTYDRYTKVRAKLKSMRIPPQAWDF